MDWEFAPVFSAGERAALVGGKPIVYECPPAAWAAAPLFAALVPSEAPGLACVAVVANRGVGDDLARAMSTTPHLRPCHVATGIARTEQLLRRGALQSLVAPPQDLLQLAQRAALKIDTARCVVLAWPEGYSEEQSSAIETLLADAPGAQRVILTAEHRAIQSLLERYAHRAPVVSTASPTRAPTAAVRFATTPTGSRWAAVGAILDQHAAASAFVWSPLPLAEGMEAPDVAVGATIPPADLALAIALDLPSPEALAALDAAAREVIVLCRPDQVPYLTSLVGSLRAIRLPYESDRARDRAASLRRRLRDRVEAGRLDGELLALAPLLDEYEPSVVAAAAAALLAEPTAPDEDVQAWTRVRLDIGRKDGARPADIVGALLNGAGLARDRVGRVEIRESHTLVEINVDDAESAARHLSGAKLRGRRVTARLERRTH